MKNKTNEQIKNIHWLGHDSFRIEMNGKQVYIDPWKIPDGSAAADLILLTHGHGDHSDPESIAKIRIGTSRIIASRKAAVSLAEADAIKLGEDESVEIISPGNETVFAGIAVRAVPAYNVNKFREPGLPFHPKEDENVGFILSHDAMSIYHSGDSDPIPEMADISVDIALMPVSGTYVMTREEALATLNNNAPEASIVIPMHIGRGIGSLDDAQWLKEQLPKKVRILSF